MAKTDYTKVERLLMEGLRKLKTQQLLELADQAAKVKANLAPAPKPNLSLPSPAVIKETIKAIKKDLKAIKEADAVAYTKLGSEQESVEALISHLAEFSGDDWSQLIALKEKIREVRREVAGVTKEEQQELHIKGEFDKLGEKGKFDFHSKDKWKSV